MSRRARRRERADAPARPASRGRALHTGATKVLSLVLVAIGLALLVTTLASGGGPRAEGVLLGVLFVAAGAGRFWVASR
jgi:hypothetical protein